MWVITLTTLQPVRGLVLAQLVDGKISYTWKKCRFHFLSDTDSLDIILVEIVRRAQLQHCIQMCHAVG